LTYMYDVHAKKKKPHIRWRPECRMLKRWLAKHQNTYFNAESMCNDLGLPREQWPRVYSCLIYWRTKFQDYMAYRYDNGLMDGPDKGALLDAAYKDFEAEWGMYAFYSDGKEYYIPDLRDSTRIDTRRMLFKGKGIDTVAHEARNKGIALPAGLIEDVQKLQEKILKIGEAAQEK